MAQSSNREAEGQTLSFWDKESIFIKAFFAYNIVKPNSGIQDALLGNTQCSKQFLVIAYTILYNKGAKE